MDPLGVAIGRSVFVRGRGLPDMAKRRRSVLAAVSGVAAALAGCVDGGDENGERTQSNRNVSDESPDDSASPTVASAFLQYQSDAGNTGALVDESGPTGAIGSLFEFGSDHRMGSPSVADGTVYVTEGRGGSGGTATAGTGTTANSGAAETTVAAVDAVDGTTQWETTYSNTAAAGATAVTEESVLAGVGGSVVALDPATGGQQWAYACGRASDITVGDGAVYVVGTVGGTATLHSLASADGSVRWERPIDADAQYTTPAVASGTVYVGGAALQAFGTARGAEQWRVETAVSTAPTVVDDSVVVGSGGSLRAYDTAGVEQWTTDVTAVAQEDTVSHSPAVASGTVYLSAAAGLGAYDLASGERSYRVELGIDGTPVVADGFVYLLDTGQLACLGADDGVTEWSYGTGQVEDPGSAAPAVVDGVAYFPAERLYAIA